MKAVKGAEIGMGEEKRDFLLQSCMNRNPSFDVSCNVIGDEGKLKTQ